MLYLVGIGLNPKQLTLEAQEILKNSDQIFLENYTSQYSQGNITQLENLIGKKFQIIGRKGVEEQFESALLSAKKNNISLMIFGNALTATTHLQVLLDAKEKGIKYKIIPGISITNTIAESGLDEYKFGRTVTICYHTQNFKPESFYDQIKNNQKIGLHTLCLLDIKKDETPERLMNCIEAINVLNSIETSRNEKNNFEYVGLIAMGSENQKIIIGEKNILRDKEITNLFPQSLIILGKLNEKEEEGLNLNK